jgi:hypothetical protein
LTAATILDEKNRCVPANFGPSTRHALRGSVRHRGRRSAATKTIYQPWRQRNERAAPQAGFDIVVISAWRLASYCFAAALPVFAAAADTGAQRSRKLLM